LPVRMRFFWLRNQDFSEANDFTAQDIHPPISQMDANGMAD